MTNFVFTAIKVVLTTNSTEFVGDHIGEKWRTNIVYESHAYEVNGKPCWHMFQPTTNVVRLELKWVEAKPIALISTNVNPFNTPPPQISQANCVTRLYDALLYTDDGSNIVNNSVAASKGRPLTADEAARWCLPPVPQYIQAMKPKQ